MIVDCYYEACVWGGGGGLNENYKKKKFEIGIFFFQIGKKVTLIPLGKGP